MFVVSGPVRGRWTNGAFLATFPWEPLRPPACPRLRASISTPSLDLSSFLSPELPWPPGSTSTPRSRRHRCATSRRSWNRPPREPMVPSGVPRRLSVDVNVLVHVGDDPLMANNVVVVRLCCRSARISDVPCRSSRLTRWSWGLFFSLLHYPLSAARRQPEPSGGTSGASKSVGLSFERRACTQPAVN